MPICRVNPHSARFVARPAMVKQDDWLGIQAAIDPDALAVVVETETRRVFFKTAFVFDASAIATQCGTSIEMLERIYSFAIEDLEDEGPKPVEEERARARPLALIDRRRQLRVA